MGELQKRIEETDQLSTALRASLTRKLQALECVLLCSHGVVSCVLCRRPRLCSLEVMEQEAELSGDQMPFYVFSSENTQNVFYTWNVFSYTFHVF